MSAAMRWVALSDVNPQIRKNLIGDVNPSSFLELTTRRAGAAPLAKKSWFYNRELLFASA